MVLKMMMLAVFSLSVPKSGVASLFVLKLGLTTNQHMRRYCDFPYDVVDIGGLGDDNDSLGDDNVDNGGMNVFNNDNDDVVLDHDDEFEGDGHGVSDNDNDDVVFDHNHEVEGDGVFDNDDNPVRRVVTERI